jgi:hypothetical protein
MFLNTATLFPEGTVLKVQFRLANSNHRIDARCEVRYCLPGVGVGVEFVDLDAKDQEAIEAELGAIKKDGLTPTNKIRGVLLK